MSHNCSAIVVSKETMLQRIKEFKMRIIAELFNRFPPRELGTMSKQLSGFEGMLSPICDHYLTSVGFAESVGASPSFSSRPR